MHNWWWEIRKAFSHMADKTADALDRRLETVGDAMVAGIADVGGDSSEAREEQLPRSLAVEGAGDAAEAEGRTHSLHEKVLLVLTPRPLDNIQYFFASYQNILAAVPDSPEMTSVVEGLLFLCILCVLSLYSKYAHSIY